MTIDKSKFIKDLKNDQYDSLYIVQKYLCNGSSPIIKDDVLFFIKHKIATKFKIHPNEIILTGSGKLGFSIAPNKAFSNFNDDSDLDFAIVSNKLFEEYWQDLLDFNIKSLSKTYKEQVLYNEFIEYLFHGWIRPDKFPFSYKGKSAWFEFFNFLTNQVYEYGEHKISAGIYKNFTTFELYNIKNLDRLRNKIKAGVINE